MPTPKGPIVLICAIDSDGEIQALEITATDELLTSIRRGGKIADVGSFLDVDGGGDTWSLLTTSMQAFWDGAAARIVRGESAGGVPNSGPQGWVSGAWQKNPVLLGFSARVLAQFQATSSNTGDTSAFSTAVPSGEIHHLSFVSLFHNDPVARTVVVYAKPNGGGAEIGVFVDVPQWAVRVISTPFVLGSGDRIEILAQGLTDTSIIYGRYWGSRIDIDQ